MGIRIRLDSTKSTTFLSRREREHQKTIQPVAAGLTGLRIDDVAGKPPSRQNELRQKKHGEDRPAG